MPEGFVCWSADGLEMIKSNVGELLDEVNDNSILAATHESMFVKAKIEGQARPYFETWVDNDLPTIDNDLMEAINKTITDPDQMRHNLLIAVKGVTGSGKSHLVRWLYQNVAKLENARIVWVIRREDSKMQVIRKFVDDLVNLGSKKAIDLRKLIDKSFKDVLDDENKLITELYNQVATELVYDTSLISGKKDEELRRLILGSNGLGNLFWNAAEEELNNLNSSEGFASVLTQVVKQLAKEARHDDTPKSQDDTPKSQIEQSGFTDAITKKILRDFARKLGNKYGSLLTISQRNVSLVTEILNEAVDIAVSKVMHIEGHGFLEIFEELRKEMQDHNQQLVIFMEDFSGVATSQKGLSKLQIDLLSVFTEEVGPERAPLRVIYAVTNNTWEVIPTNVKARHTLVVDIDRAFAGTNPLSFLSRYLNLSRSTRDLITSAYQDSDPEKRRDTTWVPNKCDQCPCRDECHRTFDATPDGIGLYPINNAAGKRLFNKTPTEPRDVVQRLQATLIAGQRSIPIHEFPSQKIVKENLVKDDDDESNMVQISFVKSAENDKESLRIARYVYNWKEGGLPNESEKRIFGFTDLGAIIGNYVKPPPDPTKPVEPVEPRKLNEFGQAALWFSADSDALSAERLTNNTMSKVRSIIYLSVKENFESLYGSLSEHESFTGLKFNEASIRVVGFEARDVLNTDLQRYYLLHRNPYGRLVMEGALTELFRRRNDLSGTTVDQDTQCRMFLADFVQTIVDDIVETVKSIKRSSSGPLGAISKVIKLSDLLNPNEDCSNETQLVKKWIDNIDISTNPVGMPDDPIDRLERSFSGLKTVLLSLTRVSTDENPRFRSILPIIDIMKGLSNSPTALIKSLFEPHEWWIKPDLTPEWHTKLKGNENAVIEAFSDRNLEIWLDDLVGHYNHMSRLFGKDLPFDADEVKELILLMLPLANLRYSTADLYASVDEISETLVRWPSLEGQIKEIILTDPNSDTYLLKKGLGSEIEKRLNSTLLLFRAISNATLQINSKIEMVGGVQVTTPFDLNVLTEVSGFELPFEN